MGLLVGSGGAHAVRAPSFITSVVRRGRAAVPREGPAFGSWRYLLEPCSSGGARGSWTYFLERTPTVFVSCDYTPVS